MEEMEVLKQHVESLGLQDKEKLYQSDMTILISDLRASEEFGLADYVQRLKTPEELHDLIVNTLYA